MRAIVLLLAALACGGCWFLDEPLKQRGPTAPEALGDGWEIATPESVGLDPRALAKIHDELLREDRHFGALGFLVIKDGKLVFETYLRDPADRDSIHHVQSVTKSVTSLAWGIAADRGIAPALDATLCSVVGDACRGLDERKRSITFEHLLTMRSGIAFGNDSFSMEMWVGEPADPLRYILEKPLHAAPGGKFDYRDADPQLIAFALHALTGRHEKQLVDEWLFGPLQIEDWYWDEGRAGVTMGAHGLHLRPRDLAKIGQLVLDRGVWRGQRIVSAAWIDASTFPQLATPEQGSQGPLSYGYYWWSAPQQQAFSAWGHGGQYALIAPERNLVIVQVAMPDAALHGARLGEFLELVAPLLGR